MPNYLKLNEAEKPKDDGFAGARRVLQRNTPEEEADAVKRAVAATSRAGQKALTHLSGPQVQMRYLEQWLNDVLTDANDKKMPGLLQRPEHAQPLSRYQIDRGTLHDRGVPLASIDRLYRSLFVNSIGFFNMIRELTKGVKEGKEHVRISIWRVYQVLLESACSSDYKMVTQRLQEENMKQIEVLMDENLKLRREFKIKEEEVSAKMAVLNAEVDSIQADRAAFEGKQAQFVE